MGTSGRSRAFLYLSFAFFLASIGCYSASAGLERHSRQITSVAFENALLTAVGGDYIIGPYQLSGTNPATGQGQTTLIDVQCQVTVQTPNGLGGTISTNVIVTENDQNGANACDAFNAFRVLFAIAGVLSLISFILSMVAAFCSDGQCARISAMIIGIIGVAAGVASFAIFIDYQKNQRHHEDYQIGFWLHIAGAGSALFGAFFAVPNPSY